VDHVDNTDVRRNLIVKSGLQELTVTILNGPYKDHETRVMNQLHGKMELDEIYEIGNTLLSDDSAFLKRV